MIQEQFFPLFSGLCPEDKTFLAEEHLKDFGNV